MQLIEAALAFAITMLALSLVVSSFVEIIHRICSMREEGLKHVLRQMFDQVIKKYLTNDQIVALVNRSRPAGQPPIAVAEEALKIFRDGFVERMSANRAPMGVTPKATPTDPASKVVTTPKRAFGLWSGRDLAAMTPAEFMERLGSMDVGQAIVDARSAAVGTVQDAGAAAAEAVEAALKDVAQKFEAFGKEASVYFEGRARLLSVVVAIALAFAAHVDAIDLFKTYLRDPNARAKVIEQSDAITAQYKAAEKTIETLSGIKAKLPPPAPPVDDPNMTAEQKAAAKKKEDDKNAAEAKALDEQIEALRKDALATIDNAKASVRQFADLGVPLGWTLDRARLAKVPFPLVWTCKDPNKAVGEGLGSLWKDCGKWQWKQVIRLQLPFAPDVALYLILGGLLVGLGAPFWYNAVTGLTDIRNSGRGTASTGPQAQAAAAAAGTTQPVTPVDVFKVSLEARR
jgi:hypothetical protein